MNKIHRVDSLSSFQLSTVLTGAMVGIGPLFVSRIAALQVGRDGWIVMLVACVIVLLNTIVLLKLAKRYPNETVIQYSPRILGKFLGKSIGAVLILSGLLICSFSLWFTGHIFSDYILVLTPPYMISFMLLALIVYGSMFDMRVLARTTVVIFLLALPFFFFFIQPYVDYGNTLYLFPMATHSLGQMTQGVLILLFSFAGYELILSLYPYVKDKQKAPFHIGWGMLLSIVILFLAVLTQQLVYPIELLEKVWLPSVDYVAYAYIHVIERTDGIFLIYWFAVLFKTGSFYFYRSVIEIQHWLGLKSKNKIIWMLAPIVLIIPCLNVSILQMETYLIYVMAGTVWLSLVFPLFYLFIDTLKGKGKLS